jgi:rhamnose transport system permease protein
MKLGKFKRELSAGAAFAVLLIAVGIIAPSFFSTANLRDLALNNASVLILATGMTMVILVGEIDISIGSQFAVCTVAAGMLAKAGLPLPLLVVSVLLIGALMGALNGWLIGWLRLPSIIVTLAMLVGWRDTLRWTTEGAWVQNLPENFQWFGLGQTGGELMIVIVSLVIFAFFSWALKFLRVGRMVYAAGSDWEVARLAGIRPRRVVWGTFILMGSLVGLAALLNSVRFSTVPSNAGVGLELKTIAAVVVGGAAITGGRGTLIGTLIGVALLGTIGTALTFVGINPFWEKAIQGLIILAALVSDVLLGQLEKNGKLGFGASAARSASAN